ncbi:MAG: oxidoreductase [Rhodospirillaceae bacterium]|jgi:acrylyl-CoA reductase (NADPH)|nr:oxidoreductase [Rhodospirillaceae bacterium]MBT5664516.1 oxidoreductase [Rhodospirillaceae bacterium]MBT5810635.1 oxidoreductase [Rhodospirillaceae bacterium]
MSSQFPALVLNEADRKVTGEIKTLTTDDLPEGDVTVAVEYSGLNYKDGMVVNGIGRLVRDYPHVPGIDFAGTVEASDNAAYKPGDKVVLTGWRVGEAHWGGYAGKARVKAGWLTPLPDGLSTKQAMAVGTAGFTSMLCVAALEDHGLTPDAGPVLVTGAAGGVGSVAVAILAKRGYSVAASTGRPALGEYLTGLGAAQIVDRAELSEPSKRPLETETWAGAIDTVGATTLARALSQMKYGASVAACGLAGGANLESTVLPFLLRGVNLLGIDSVMQPAENRVRIWARVVDDLPLEKLDEMTDIIGLGDVQGAANDILKGQVRGRLVVDVNA